jgi:rhodanese-related sulfurtransferase
MRRARQVSIVAIVAGVTSIFVGCGDGSQTQQLTDAQKRARLEALYQGYRQSFPGVESITVEELLELQRGSRPVVLVDVREPEEMEVSMIPGAIDAETFEREAEAYRGAVVVPYCTAGYRSGLYTQELQKAGWEALNLEGSILAWTLAGLPLQDAEGPTDRVHVYGRTWDLAADDFTTIW